MDAVSVPPQRFWAKVDAEGDWHPLIAHCADVAAVLERLLSPDSLLSSRLASAAGRSELDEPVRSALVYLAALHDIGKANHGFQSKAGRPEEVGRWPRAGHVKVLLESLGFRPLRQLLGELLDPVSGDAAAAQELLLATISHHGRPWADVPRNVLLDGLWQGSDSRDPLAEIRRIGACAARWSGLSSHEANVQLPRNPEFTHVYAGLLTLADWIGSTRAAYPFSPEADDDPDTYWDTARRLADAACLRIGTIPSARCDVAPGAGLLEQLFPQVFPRFEPTPLQRHVANMELPPQGSRLLIESDTGSGKTEAVLSLYARLRAENRVAGLVFALPTRATATAMIRRVRAATERLYPPGEAPSIALAVGGEQPRIFAEEQLLRELPLLFPDPEDRELRRWASSSGKKFFAAEIVVGTVDQVLLGGLPVKHAHLRLAALTRHLLVVDELHSYDRYMGEVLARVLSLHSHVGGLSAFMSATLSEIERRRYAFQPHQDFPSMEVAIARPYPVLSVCEPDGLDWDDVDFQAGKTPPVRKRISWELCRDDQLIDTALAAARGGARVCILHNTVQRARETCRALAAMPDGRRLLWRAPGGRQTPPYHSRYIHSDRVALDTKVLADFGRDGESDRGTILVATQVVEQSLDVDFDFFITDLAPVDALLQRLGRLHRHPERVRPGEFLGARAWIVAPEAGFGDVVRAGRRKAPAGWGTVYPDLADLELTSRLIGREHTIEIPRDNRALIESVYHPTSREALSAEDPGWARYIEKADSLQLGNEVYGRQLALQLRTATYSGCARQFDLAAEAEAAVRTRLGDDSVRLELPGKVFPIYGDRPTSHVDLPVWVLPPRETDGETAIEDWSQGEEGTAFRVGEWEVWYDPTGWNWQKTS